MGSPVAEIQRDKNEGPQHKVTIKSFALGKTEVTFDEYDRFANATKRKRPSDQKNGRGNRLVIYVSWKDATAYASWLSEQTGKAYRLPTEAEWEYAARAGTATAFNTGDCINPNQANYRGDFEYSTCRAIVRIRRGKTLPVDELPPNPWGLQHMHGNVFEWTPDCWHVNYYGAPNDGSVWKDGQSGDCGARVIRVGGWIDHTRELRSAFRDKQKSDDGYYALGFRLARTL